MRLFPRLLLFVFVLTSFVYSQKPPAPVDVLGFTPGDDKKLASWNQIVDYFKKLDAGSDRVKFEEIGKTTMGAPFVYATISAPENLKNLEKYKQTNAKLADPRTIKSNDKLAESLIKQGKTIVLITCGIHSTEVGSTLSSMLIAHRLASSNEPEIQKILQNTIVLLVPSLNPDGVDIVKNWYDKTLGTKFEGTTPPELYHKYVGHDNNRDWYAFTQIETQLTVDKIHNQWHPQIVNDIHQQGANGARLFVPPYMKPIEPNVPKEIVEGYTELGNYIRDEMTRAGFAGITNDSIYDAWTPARAYSHYHGGVRILTETASARLASPIKVEFEKLRVDASDNYDPQKASANFPKLWQGGDWTLRDITNYMTASSFTLLKHAAENREAWLKRFYAIGKEATRPRKSGELFGFIIPSSDYKGFYNPQFRLRELLRRAGVEYEETDKGWLVKMEQPYGSFAKAMLEKQNYPDLKDEKGNPIPPYDVTAHTLGLFYDLDIKTVAAPFEYKKDSIGFISGISGCGYRAKTLLYKSHIPSMDEGWTRWIFDGQGKCITHLSIEDTEIRSNNFTSNFKTIIFPDQSPNQILNGYAKGAMPDEYTGGIGAEGVANLREFVEAGGTLVFLNRASNFAIEQFNLPVKDVTRGLNKKDFYIPGSILRTELDTAHPSVKGMPKDSIAWFEDSPAFEITDNTNVKVIARYPANSKDILLSGWALGAEKLAGKAALVEVKLGKGKIILFGFRPQYRGQSLATFPLLFNSIGN
ncbi:MAG: M14 family zinc carboxypeptidase [Pyrinomonadaceae bacterium]